MKLFCPNCQKELIIEDQYAGQEMKCPMCQGQFTAPAAASFETKAPESPPPEPEEPPPEPKQEQTDGQPQPQPRREPVPETPVGDYTGKMTVNFNPMILAWIPLAAMVVIGILTWFNWIWIGGGGVTMVSQNGALGAFGVVWKDPDFAEESPVKDALANTGISFLTLVYVWMLLPLSVLLCMVAAAIKLVPITLPPAVTGLLKWKWAAAAGVILLGFLTLLMLFYVVGFSAENGMSSKLGQDYRKNSSDVTPGSTMAKRLELSYQSQLETIHRTTVLSAVFWLHLLALICAAIMFWTEFRNSPGPRIDVLY